MSHLLLFLAILALLTGCHESQQQKQAAEQKQQAESRKTQILVRYPGAIGIDDDFSLTRRLTIDIQDSIAANTNQFYWSEVSNFDLHRTKSGLRITFSPNPTLKNNWFTLDCSDELAATIRKAYNSEMIFPRFLFVYRLASVSPLRIELSDEVGSLDTVMLEPVSEAGERLAYTGSFVDFALLDPGTPTSARVKQHRSTP